MTSPGRERPRAAHDDDARLDRPDDEGSSPLLAERRARRTGPGFPMRERSSIASVLGLPPVAAFALAAGGTVLGVLIDILRIGTVGGVFTAFYFMACVLAVAWVRRRNLFGPMVQPPLLLAVTVPAVVLLAAPPRPGSGITEQLIAVGAPLINAFPTMATTTAVVLAGGALRILLQPLRPGASGAVSRVLAGGRGRRAART